jgi:hypothetical protein
MAVTLNGVTQSAPITAGTGAFTATFDGQGLTAAPAPYSIQFGYEGDAVFAGASGSGTLTVLPAGYAYDPATWVLTVTGTAATNSFTFAQATTVDGSGKLHTTYTFTLNGATLSMADAMLARVAVSATGSGNTAALTTSDTYTGSDGKPHETQEAVLFGSGGYGQLYTVDAHGNGAFFLTLAGFTHESAAMGPADSGLVIATSGVQNFFVSSGGYAYMDSGDAFYGVSGAKYVYGLAVNSYDVAYHYDGTGASALVMSGTAYSLMLGTDHGASFFNEAVGFTNNYGIATHPGQDSAYFYDSPGNDVFVGNKATATAPANSELYIGRSDGSYAEFDYGQGFALVYAYSFVGGTDYAYVYDTGINHVSFFDPASGYGYHRLA